VSPRKRQFYISLGHLFYAACNGRGGKNPGEQNCTEAWEGITDAQNPAKSTRKTQ